MSIISAALRPDTQPTAASDPRLSRDASDSYWRSLYFFNGYRFIVALLLL